MGIAADWTIRAVDRARDRAGIEALDTRASSDARYELVADAAGHHLVRRHTDRPHESVYRIDLDADAWDEGYVAILGGQVAGFIATGYQEWNRRCVIWHFYVAPHARRRGLGRALMHHAEASGRRRGALTLWAETSNLNGAAVAAYRRLGFDLCGYDATLYRGTAADDQFAVFLGRAL